MISPRLAPSCPCDRQAEVGIGMGTVHSGARAQAQELLAPLEGSLSREGHQVAELGPLAGRGRKEAPGDGGRHTGVVARLDQALEVERFTIGHAGRP